MKQKSEFIGQLSHDIRTPLTPISVMAEILKNSLKKKDNLEKVEVISRNAKYLNTLVHDTLSLTRLESNQMKLSKSDVNLHKLVNEVIKMNKIVLSDKKIACVNDIDKNIIIFVDAFKLKEVFQNLIVNATKFTSKGKIIFSCILISGYFSFSF